jgi:hypothetical protein
MWMKRDLIIVKTIPMVIVLEGKDAWHSNVEEKRKSQLISAITKPGKS